MRFEGGRDVRFDVSHKKNTEAQLNNSTEYPYCDYTIDVGPAAASAGGWSSLFRVARNGATVYRGQGQASPDPRQAEGLARNSGYEHVDQLEGKRVRLGPSFYELPDANEARLARRWLTDVRMLLPTNSPTDSKTPLSASSSVAVKRFSRKASRCLTDETISRTRTRGASRTQDRQTDQPVPLFSKSTYEGSHAFQLHRK